MATANGTLTPPSAPADSSVPATADISAHKRKREDEVPPHDQHNKGLATSAGSAQTQKDLLEILQRYDVSPSFLHHEFHDHDAAAGEPSHKKARLVDGTVKATIAGKLSDGAYATLAALKSDASLVSRDIETSLRTKAKETESQSAGRVSVDELKQIQRAKAFEDFILDMLDKEIQYEAVHHHRNPKQEPATMANGTDATAAAASAGAGPVLTLFGNAPTPKQLFSSMQHPSSTNKGDRGLKSELPVEEMSLPNGLAATKIIRAPADEGKKGPTFEDAFAPPYNLPVLNPPKAHKRSSTRDTTITWEFKDLVHRGSRKGGYTVQTLTDGSWLGYGGLDSLQDAASPRDKRKRDRTLSNGTESAKEPPTKASLEEEEARQAEALFRRAFSSFAPSHDNSKAIIPAEQKANIWWNKTGEARYNEVFGGYQDVIDPALLVEPEPQLQPAKEEDFGKAIKDLLELDEAVPETGVATSKTDVEQVLREVSALLESLASHQRIRNVSLPSSTSASRPPISPAPTLAARIGKPDEPAEDEISTYHSLRRELAYLILKLPPFAVAKLDGDQLAELGVSRVIPFEAKDIKGTLEEDQVARLAKYTAMQTAAGLASLSRSNSTSGQHYSTTAQRTPAIGQAANTRYGQSSQYGVTRTPATQQQFQRSTSSQAQYGTPGASAARPSYGHQPSQYTRPGAPQQTYSQSNGQQYYQQQRPPQTPGGYTGFGQQYHQTPQQSQQRPAFGQTPQPYQQRAHSAAANAVAYQTNASTQAQQSFNRTASPATKPTWYGQAQQSVQPRPAYQYGQPPTQQGVQPGSGRATPSYSSQPQTPVNGFQRPPPQPIAARGSSGTPQPPSATHTQPNGHA